METRANYVLIGAFTIAAIVAGLGFFLWLAQLRVDRQFDYYDVLFTDVSGLNVSSDVSLNGLTVGKVIKMGINRSDPSLVRVEIEVADGTPVKTDTVAKLQSQGVTGVSYVSLSGGSASSEPLTAPEDGGNPTIRAERSAVQQITEDAPDILSEGLKLLKNIQAFAGPENQKHVSDILENADVASSKLETALNDFSDISRSVATATQKIAAFAERIEPLTAAFMKTLDNADTALISTTAAFDQGKTTLQTADSVMASASGAISGVEALINTEVPAILENVQSAVTDLRAAVVGIETDARGTLTEFTTAASSVNARVNQLEGTITDFDTLIKDAGGTFESVETASNSFDKLINGEGGLLVDDLRRVLANVDTAVSTINSTVTRDLPGVVDDVKNAVTTVRRVVDQVGTDVTTFTGEIRPLTNSATATFAAATDTFQRSSTTLEVLDRTLAAAEDTLKTAEVTFGAATVVIDRDVQPAAADIRTAARSVNDAVQDVTDDLPQITADIRDMVARANDVVAQLDRSVTNAAPSVQTFATVGLPEITNLSREARNLIAHLDRIANRLERDPTRFLLGGQTPDYRR